ncbi:MAG TPA: adenylate/guanylate cyclase domain-containing protein [Terriglobia bacterium]|nr:adenylate/guanylate cyclase domain-containing protein [Terriglobia bacterium]
MKQVPSWVKSKVFQAIALGLASGLLVLGASRMGWLDTLEGKSLDWRFRNFTQANRGRKDIVIIALDDTSFTAPEMVENFGRWPWRRNFWALIVHYLHQCGAKVIGLDMTFEGKDPHQGDDELFAQVLREKRDVVLALGMNEGKFVFTDPKEERAFEKRLDQFAWPVKQDIEVPFHTYSGVALSEDTFLSASGGAGSIAIQADPDGPTRSIAPLHRFHDQLIPAFAFAIAARYIGEPPQPSIDAGPTLNVFSRQVPLDPNGGMLIRWHGDERIVYPYFSAWKVVNAALELDSGDKPDIPSETFRNKIVLIGPTATALADLHANAFSPHYPGVEIHATVIDNLLSGEFMRRTGPMIGATTILGMALMMSGLVYWFKSALNYSLLALCIGLAYVGGVCWLFRSHDIWAPFAAPLLAGSIAFIDSTLVQYATEGREKAKYRKTLIKYISPQLVETIMADMDWESLRAEKRNLTVLFSDIRGFTSISEKLPAETVIKTLNEHLNMMVSVIFDHQGTLDKFVGDCVMAFWGAPLPQPNHAELAARSALAMIKGLENLNKKWQSEGRPTLQIGVGVNTGEMLFGNIGSEQRMDFTVIGDSVNLGSRLESATKELHASIVISDSTYQIIRDLAQVRPLGEISVKGKAQKIVVYELLGMTETPQVKEAAS